MSPAREDERAVAINVAANTTLPGVRGPVHPDGRFEYVPIPEREPTAEPVPTYADLDLTIDLPADLLDRRVHLDPEFAGVHGRTAHTYGDEHGVKAGPLARLDPGDSLYFYATLSFRGDPAAAAPFVRPDWAAYLIGEFRIAAVASGDPVPPTAREGFESNAHHRREQFDARVLVRGDDRSGLFDRVVPLSAGPGTVANRLVTALSADSGAGPWWRRVLRFDPAATRRLRDVVADPAAAADAADGPFDA